MEKKKDNPGVHIPPPLIYAATFFASLFIQKRLPISKNFFGSMTSVLIGWVAIGTSLFFAFPALVKFFRTKNTLITIKPANSLQTTGIYSISRNPMYTGLLFLYIGLSFLLGNWWNLILLPLLFFILQEYVIKREEQYLNRRFGKPYLDYKTKVKRWL